MTGPKVSSLPACMSGVTPSRIVGSKKYGPRSGRARPPARTVAPLAIASSTWAVTASSWAWEIKRPHVHPPPDARLEAERLHARHEPVWISSAIDSCTSIARWTRTAVRRWRSRPAPRPRRPLQVGVAHVRSVAFLPPSSSEQPISRSPQPLATRGRPGRAGEHADVVGPLDDGLTPGCPSPVTTCRGPWASLPPPAAPRPTAPSRIDWLSGRRPPRCRPAEPGARRTGPS